MSPLWKVAEPAGAQDEDDGFAELDRCGGCGLLTSSYDEYGNPMCGACQFAPYED